MFKINIENLNESYVRIGSNNGAVYSDLSEQFTFTVPDAHFKRKNVKTSDGKPWDGKIRLFNKMHRTIYKGLLREVLDMLQSDDYGDIKLSGFEKLEKLDEKFDEDLIATFGIPEKFDPRDYAVDATRQALKQRRATIESPTSSGKSMLIYYLYRTIKQFDLAPGEKFLIVVPSVFLVDQMAADFREYGYNGDIHKMAEGSSKDADCPLYISTWQSLRLVKDSYFKQFKAVVIDEAHGADATEMRRIMEQSTNALYRYGTSGTFKDCAISGLVLRGLFGKNIVAVTMQELKERGYVANTNIVMHRLMYGERLAPVVENAETYQDELKNVVLKSKQRDAIIMKIIERENDKNGLVLFNTIKHGERLIETFQKTFPNREYRVITGSVKREERFTIKEDIDAETLPRGTVVFATYGTMSTGVSIKNLDFGLFAHPLKSKIKVLQSLGRLLRLSATKTKATLHDVWDDLTTASRKKKKCFGKSHAMERVLLYNNDGYEIEEVRWKVE